MTIPYAEIGITTNFSFLRGASHPGEFVEQAAALGHAAIGITDRNSLAGVVRVEGPERIAMEWWRQDGEALTRDYFRVEDAEGLRFWIFRDGLYESELRDEEGRAVPANWFVHGLFA